MNDEPAAADPNLGPPPVELAPLGAPAPKVRKMQYLRSFQYVFELEKWWIGLILASICVFIPAFGAAVILGYQYEVVEMLIRGRQLPYPPFEFKRFARLANRGVWMFLITLFIQTILQIPLQFGMQFGIMGMMMLFQADQQTATIVLAIGIPVVLIAVMSFVLALWMITTPIFLRAGLTQDLAQTFNKAWIQDFLRKMWREMLLTACFLTISFFLLAFVGLLACGFGLYPAMIIGMLISSHQLSQLYQIFLDRGGDPLPLQPLPAEPPPAVIPDSPYAPSPSSSPFGA